ncbi:MAG: NRDE family protein [Nocardiaceae bacterium]|nr:NRDE family protein [Nocardiaceae bacterium]
MCLILTAWDAHPEYKLVVAANRDEFFARESAPMAWWEDQPILAGRDLSVPNGGTWLALARSGRFAAVTNVRDFERQVPGARTRGQLPVRYVGGDDSPGAYLHNIEGEHFNGYNLLVSDLTELWWASNWWGEPTKLDPGVYGLSNAALDTPWPKVTEGKRMFTEALEADDVEAFFASLANDTQAPDDELPSTGIPLELERLASAAFIVSPEYGTNASTLLRVRHDGTFDIEERRFAVGQETGRVRFEGRVPA